MSICVATCCIANPVSAQPLIPFEDATLTRRLASVQDLLDAKEWDRAINILESAIATAREQVLPVGEAHYLNGSEYARVLLTQLPAAGLTYYRSRKESQAAEWLRQAKLNHNSKLLEVIVREAFLTRSAEEALLLLGEWCFQDGEFANARRWWTMLVPLQPVPGIQSTVIRFPDPQTDQSDVLARLVLCSILEGDGERANRELRAFSERFPESTGKLAGREGRWPDLLADFASAEFGQSDSDAGYIKPTLSVGRPLWQAPHQPGRSFPIADIIPSLSQDLILWNTNREVYAVQLETGEPAWIKTPSRSPEKWFRLSRLYPPGPQLPAELPEREVFGSTTACLTISDGRAYFRSGGSVSAYSPDEFRRSDSSLVCLDLVDGEGLLRWKVDADVLDEQAQLRFAGPPLVQSERVYILGRRGLLPSELHLICLNRDDGEFLWSRLICSNGPSVPEGANLAECLQVTTSNGQIVIASKLGCLASFSLADGRPLWYHTYNTHDESEARNPFPGSVEQALVYEDRVLAAPGDGQEVFALDLATGDTIWAQPAVRQEEVLGAIDSRLLTTGNSLICRHIADGKILWKYTPGSETQLVGRPLIFGQDVWWPTHREILVFDIRSGQMSRRIPLADRDGLRGGNLLTDGSRLIVSGTRSVTVFSPFGSAPANRAPRRSK